MAWTGAERCAPPAAFCDLWRPFHTAVGAHWEGVPAEARGWSRPWRNIRPTPPSAALLRAAARPLPSERCAALGLPLAAAVEPAHKMHWLHFPKAGSSFGTTLMHRGCPRIPADAAADDGAPIVSLTSRYPRGRRRWCDRDAFVGNLNGHEPMRYPEHRGRTVALFREPRARLASECAAIEAELVRAFGRARPRGPPRRRLRRSRREVKWRVRAQAAGGGGGAGTDAVSARADDAWDGSEVWLGGAASVYAAPFLRQFLYSHGLSHAAIRAIAASWNATRSLPLAECAALDGMSGCQTKMTLGVPCAAPFELNASHLAEAVRRVGHDFRYVGLTDRWDASVCLFHASLGGSPVPAQFLNTRPRAPGGRGQRVSERAALPADPWDEALYAAAAARFARDVLAARLAPNRSVPR